MLNIRPPVRFSFKYNKNCLLCFWDKVKTDNEVCVQDGEWVEETLRYFRWYYAIREEVD